MGADDRDGFAGQTAGLLDGFGFHRLPGEALHRVLDYRRGTRVDLAGEPVGFPDRGASHAQGRDARADDESGGQERGGMFGLRRQDRIAVIARPARPEGTSRSIGPAGFRCLARGERRNQRIARSARRDAIVEDRDCRQVQSGFSGWFAVPLSVVIGILPLRMV